MPKCFRPPVFPSIGHIVLQQTIRWPKAQPHRPIQFRLAFRFSKRFYNLDVLAKPPIGNYVAFVRAHMVIGFVCMDGVDGNREKHSNLPATIIIIWFLAKSSRIKLHRNKRNDFSMSYVWVCVCVQFWSYIESRVSCTLLDARKCV